MQKPTAKDGVSRTPKRAVAANKPVPPGPERPAPIAMLSSPAGRQKHNSPAVSLPGPLGSQGRTALGWRVGQSGVLAVGVESTGKGGASGWLAIVPPAAPATESRASGCSGASTERAGAAAAAAPAVGGFSGNRPVAGPRHCAAVDGPESGRGKPLRPPAATCGRAVGVRPGARRISGARQCGAPRSPSTGPGGLAAVPGAAAAAPAASVVRASVLGPVGERAPVAAIRVEGAPGDFVAQRAAARRRADERRRARQVLHRQRHSQHVGIPQPSTAPGKYLQKQAATTTLPGDEPETGLGAEDAALRVGSNGGRNGDAVLQAWPGGGQHAPSSGFTGSAVDSNGRTLPRLDQGQPFSSQGFLNPWTPAQQRIPQATAAAQIWQGPGLSADMPGWTRIGEAALSIPAIYVQYFVPVLPRKNKLPQCFNLDVCSTCGTAKSTQHRERSEVLASACVREGTSCRSLEGDSRAEPAAFAGQSAG